MAPVIALLVIGAVVATTVLVVASKSLNENVLQSEQLLSRTAMSAQQEALSNLAFDYTWWDDIALNIIEEYDPEWADGNIGSYLHDTYAISHSFVVDEEGRTRSAFILRKSVPDADALEILPDDVGVLVARARKASYAQPIPHAGFTLLDATLHLVTASAITPEQVPDPLPAETARPVLILAKAIGPELLAEMGEAYTLENFRFVRGASPPGSTWIDLKGINGAPIGRLVWQSNKPGTEFVDRYWPALAGTFIGMMLLAVYFLRRADQNWWDVMQLRVRLTDEMHARRHEAGIAHLQRLNVVGEMATTLAHELNQPLTSISSYAQGCVDRLRPGEPATPDILDAMKQIVAQAERADGIIRRIRDFVRRDAAELVPMNLNTLIQETAILLHSALRDGGVRVEWRLADDLPDVVANPVQLQQVFVNLIQNAIDAMQKVEPADRRIKIATKDLGVGEVELIMVDNGHGFTSEALERAFDPFFTTKGSGMGMGLAISRSIVEGHGGDLTVASAPEGGAVFRLTLPIRGGKTDGE
ncbi:MAG: ATP-binding protein [Rhodospirillales bacterium]